MDPPPFPSEKQIVYPFETDFTDDEHAFAQEVLEDNAKSKTIGCFLMAGAWIVFLIVKLATIHVSFVFIPFVLLAIFLQQFCGMRFWRLKNGGSMVLWLRRFHRSDLRQFPFGTFLQSIVGNELTPITIQDSTYKIWWNSVVARGVVPLVALLFVGVSTAIAVSILLIFSITYLLQLIFTEDQAAMVAGIAGVPTGLFLIIYLPYRLIRRAGFHKLKKKNYSTRFAKFTERALAGRSTHSLQIFKCDDDFWQDVVLSALSSCRVVVIDVTSLGENVEWELQQAERLVEPRRIVLCCATQNGRLMFDEGELMTKLLNIFGEEKLRRIRRITYEIPVLKQNILKRITRNVLAIAILRHRDAFVKLQRAITLANNGILQER